MDAGCGHLAVVHRGNRLVPSVYLHAMGFVQCHPSLPHPALCYVWPGKPLTPLVELELAASCTAAHKYTLGPS